MEKIKKIVFLLSIGIIGYILFIKNAKWTIIMSNTRIEGLNIFTDFTQDTAISPWGNKYPAKYINGKWYYIKNNEEHYLPPEKIKEIKIKE